MTEFGQPARPTRRRVLAALSGATAVAWSAPQIVATSRAGAATTYNVVMDANCVITDADGYTGAAPTYSNNPMLMGGTITISEPGCTFLSGTGDWDCLASSTPKSGTETGTVQAGGTEIVFADVSGTEQCFYFEFTLEISCIS